MYVHLFPFVLNTVMVLLSLLICLVCTLKFNNRKTKLPKCFADWLFAVVLYSSLCSNCMEFIGMDIKFTDSSLNFKVCSVLPKSRIKAYLEGGA